MDFRSKLAALLAGETGIAPTEIETLLEVPPQEALGDYAFPCFVLAKQFKKGPVQVAAELAQRLKKPAFVGRAEAAGPYVNFFLNQEHLAKAVLPAVAKQKKKYGAANIGQRKTLVIDFSSPNIAKPFGIGHLRSTVIGNSLGRIFSFLGYRVIGVNHLGDWGTQFGKLIAAYKRWGSEQSLEKEPIHELLRLYVRFHKEAEQQKALEDEAREWFKKLEDGDKEALALWETFRELSVREFSRIYQLLGVEFDYLHGESHYNTFLDETIALAEEKRITELSDGALVVPLEGVPRLVLRKKDGATTYATRDIAAALHRLKEYRPARIIYVVGIEQGLRFQQLFAALTLLNAPAEKFIHVDFGLIRFPEGRMSTRRGNVIFLEEVLQKAIALVREAIEAKNPALEDKDAVARDVGVGAIIFGDLVNDRVRDITFDWKRILDFEGDSGPYVQYTHARACSILRKAAKGITPKARIALLLQPEEVRLVKLLAQFPPAVQLAAQGFKPHHIAQHLLKLSQAFNAFYHQHPVIQEDEELLKARLLLVDCVRQVLANGLALLGITAPEGM